MNENKFSVIKSYGVDLTAKKYVSNPAIARDMEIRKLMLVLLTPDKSGLLVGKPGIGKTSIVEGLAYQIICGNVPEILKGYKIIKINSTSLTGTATINGNSEMMMNLFIEEATRMENTIFFIDEIHTLIGAKGAGPMDLANILKPAIDRGELKVIGATTTIEYDTYVIRDRAFLRRFEKIEVAEPDEPTTVQILKGSLPRMTAQTGAKMKYSDFINETLIESIVSATSEFKRVYGLSAMYPDIAFSVLSNSFSEALVDNRFEVTIVDVYNAIKNSKRIYSDSIVKELKAFREKHAKLAMEEGVNLPVYTIDDIEKNSDL